MTCHFIDHFTIEIFQISPKAASVSSYLTQIRQRSLTVEAPYTVQLVGALINLEIKVFMKVVNSWCCPTCKTVKTQKYHFIEQLLFVIKVKLELFDRFYKI